MRFNDRSLVLNRGVGVQLLLIVQLVKLILARFVGSIVAFAGVIIVSGRFRCVLLCLICASFLNYYMNSDYSEFLCQQYSPNNYFATNTLS